MADDEIIDVEPLAIEDDDTDYWSVVEQLNTEFPAIDAKKIDFTRFKGRHRLCKAIVVHLAASVGWPPQDIATAMQLPINKVCDYLYDGIQDNLETWDLETIRKFELMKFDRLEKKANIGLDKSFQDAIEETTHIDQEDGEDVEVTTRKRKGQSGNPAWAQLLLEINKRRSALLGLDQATKVQVTKDTRQVRINITEVRDRDAALAPAKNAGLLESPNNK